MIKKKTCPRCGEKREIDKPKCDYCGLNFSKLSLATNAAGKKMLKEKKRDKVIFVKKTPSDVAKWKLFLMALFLGIFGGHYYYVGRNLAGALMTAGGVVFVVGFVLSLQSISYRLKGFVVCIVGIVALVWLVDCLNILINQFKIPVSIDVEGK